jgi:electron transfer flavoprotein alpha subunit
MAGERNERADAMTRVLVLVEHDRGALAPAALEAMTFGRAIGEVVALTIGAAADPLVDVLASHGATEVHQAHHTLLGDYNPQAWGDVVAGAIRYLAPEFVVAAGTDVGNEVLANAAAVLDVPLVANCLAVESLQPPRLRRVRWGGSLIEVAELEATVRMLTVAPHAVAAVLADVPAAGAPRPFDAELDAAVVRSAVVERVEREAGITLATAPVVVGGGRGVGSAEGFGPLEELAGLLGGVVGCSRAVTNNGWRNHTDQVGQTGTRIAPELYIACGISGAIQHWVGAMASKRILAINTDPEANMVTKADYAVIGDLHEVVPAISAELRRRRDASAPP